MKGFFIGVLFFFMLATSVFGEDAFYESQLDRGVSNSDACSYVLIRQARENRPQSADLLKRALA